MSDNTQDEKLERVCAWCNRHEQNGEYVVLSPEQWLALAGKPITHGICPECNTKERKAIETETAFIRRAMVAHREQSALAA